MLVNMARSGNKLLQGAVEVLRDLLPKGWSARLETGLSGPTDRAENAHIAIRAPDGGTGRVLLEAKRSWTPRDVIEHRTHLRETGSNVAARLVVAPFLSRRVQERLSEHGIGFIDLTGNVRIELSSPGLFVLAPGAEVNPFREERRKRTLRGAKAGRIARTLIERTDPPGVRELADLTGTDPGYVSRILASLDRDALLERGKRGRVEHVDWQRLLRRWAEDAPLATRGHQILCLHPRGLSALTSRLKESNLRYALTGTLAAAGVAPAAATRLAIVYVDDAATTLATLGIPITERGANVMLIEPEDEWVFERTTVHDGLELVSIAQAAADLLSAPGRGPAEAEILIEWMSEHEEAWRG